jgi:hypothetical protein
LNQVVNRGTNETVKLRNRIFLYRDKMRSCCSGVNDPVSDPQVPVGSGIRGCLGGLAFLARRLALVFLDMLSLGPVVAAFTVRVTEGS